MQPAPQNPVVSSLHIYPVKSCAAVDVQQVVVSPRGFIIGNILDRSWMVVDSHGKLVSQREQPTLARVKIDLVNGANGKASAIHLSADSMLELTLDASQVRDERRNLIIHGKPAVGHAASDVADKWFSDYLGQPVFLVHQTEEDVRLCNPDFSVDPQHDAVSFADGFPYLITTLGTLKKLNGFLQSPVPMTRFRSNIVIDGALPEEEYTWYEVMIGDIGFRFVKPCTRCVMTTIDQTLGLKVDKEPLASLAKHYFLSEKFGEARVQGAVFGENAIALNGGSISIGDEIKPLTTKPKYAFRQRTQLSF
jgi:uncharacterized protein YcbX